MFTVLWFLAIFGMGFVLSEDCDINDHDCTTKGANNSFGPFVNGTDNIVEASDPLRVDLIEDKQSTFSYKLTNASLIGMKNCGVTSLKIDKEASYFLFNLECPHIVVKTEYEIKGKIIDLYVEGKGTITITADDYVFMFDCKYEKTVAKDNKTYVLIKSHDVDVDYKGKVTFDITNLYNGDKEKSDVVHNYINENWKTIDKLFRTPSIDRFMELFIENLNTFLKVVPVQNVLSSKTEL